MLTIVKNDLHNIVQRLKKVNRAYRVFYNHSLGRYEVHNRNRPNSLTLCFIVPFQSLDERTLEYAHKTKIENFDDIEKAQSEHNASIEQSAKRKLAESSAALADMLDFAAKQSHEVVFYKSSKWF